MLYNKSVFSLFFSLLSFGLKSQNPVADFEIANSYCQKEEISIINNSINSINYLWDFCGKEFDNQPVEKSLGSLSGITRVNAMDIAFDEISGNYVTIIADFNSNKISRIVFGDSLGDTFLHEGVIVNSGDLSRPDGLELVKNSNGDWIGFIGSSSTDFGISRINFGNSLMNSVTIESIGNFNQSSSLLREVKIQKIDGNYYLLILNYFNENLIIVNYGNSVLNDPISILENQHVPGLVNAGGFDIIKKNGEWIAYITSIDGIDLVRLNYGNSILNIPVLEGCYSLEGIDKPFKIKLITSGDNYYALITDFNSGVSTYNLNNLSNSSQINNFNYPLSKSYSITGMYFKGNFNYYSFTGDKINRINFTSNCNESISFSINTSPIVSYGKINSEINVTLYAQDVNGNIDSQTKQITVLENPIVNFSQTNTCTNQLSSFTDETISTNGNITSWNWGFESLGNASVQNPSFQFDNTGNFDIKLIATDESGCIDSISKTIKIYDENDLSPSFSISGLPCTDTNFPFTDESTFTEDVITNWSWNFGDASSGVNDTSTIQNPSHLYQTIGNYDVSLTVTGTSGCQKTVINPTSGQLNIIVGPTVSFSLSDNCQGESTPFTNQTTGDNIIGYTWDFGDTSGLSTELNPSYDYPNDGSYTVKLDVTNQAGCVNSSSQQVEIFKKAPVPAFLLSETIHCTDLSEVYTNATDESGFSSGEVSYNWNFDDENFSSQKDTTYVFTTLGEKQLSLSTTTPDNCQATTTSSITVKQGSVVDFQFADNCQGDNTSFSNLSSGGNITDYSWSFGDGTGVSSVFAPSYLYTSVGDYNVSLQVTNQSGCVNSVTKPIAIFKKAPIPVFATSQAVHCVGLSEAFTNSTDESNFNPNEIAYLWDFDNELTSNQKDTLYTFNTAGTKQITLQSITPDNCTTATVQSIDINESPSAGFQIVDNCIGESTVFTNQTTGSNIVSYLWDFGDGFTNNNANPTHLYAISGTYDVALTSANSLGCETSIHKTILVNALPIVNFTNEVGCEGQSVKFTDASTAQNANIEAWSWNFDGQGVSTEANPEFIFTDTGTFEVTLNTTTNFGCSASTTQSITIHSSPQPDFSASIGCLNELSSFTDFTITEDTNPIISLFWEIDGQVFTSQNVDYVFTQPGTYDINLTVTPQNACAEFLTKQITIEPLPSVVFEVENTCDNQFVTFKDKSTSSPSPIVSRIWDFAGLGTANGSEAAFKFSESGTYEVTLTVIAESGCTSLLSQQVEIQQAPIAEFSVSTDFGPPPLVVEFTNSSSDADSYTWAFNDHLNTTSADKNPVYTFTELGKYNVKLIAQNNFGCTDTTSTIIEVVLPDLNLSLTSIESQLDNGNIRLLLTVENEGTIDVDGFNIKIDLANEFSIVEKYDNLFRAKETISFPLNFEIPAASSNIGFVCFTIIDNDSDNLDSDLMSNEGCINFEQELAIENPFPNPTTGDINFNLVLPSESPIQIALINVYGKVVFDENYTNLNAGLNSFNIKTNQLYKGLYFLRIIHNGNTSIRRIVKL